MILLIILVLIAIVFIILTIIYLLALTRLYNNTPLARIRTLTRNSEHLITYAFIVSFIGVVVSLPAAVTFPYITSTLDQRITYILFSLLFVLSLSAAIITLVANIKLLRYALAASILASILCLIPLISSYSSKNKPILNGRCQSFLT